MQKSNKLYFFGIILALGFILVYSFSTDRVKTNYAQTLSEFRADKDKFFKEAGESPVENKTTFTRLSYYPPSQGYRMVAGFEAISDTATLGIRMTDGKTERFVRQGYAVFTLKEKAHRLLLLRKVDEGVDQGLFLPFTDKTNGFETYGGGRYLDVEPPKNGQVVVDFNFAYNPYCAYNSHYSCPLPPAENKLNIQIRAGERDFAHADTLAKPTTESAK